MRCSNCDTPLAAAAKFCPRCGHAAPGSLDPARPVDRLPAKAPIPRGAKLLIAAVVAIPLLLVAGIFVHKALLVIGIAMIALLVVFFALGLVM